MDVLNEFLKTKGLYTLVMILFFLGVYGMVLSKNYMKKLMAMNVMQVAVIYFYLCFAQKDGAMIPIQNGITTDPSMYINPLPHGVREIFSKFRKIVVCELNEGQFANYLRQSLQEFRYEQYNKCEGLPFTVAELCQKFESLLK